MDNSRLFYVFGHRPYIIYSILTFALFFIIISVPMPHKCTIIFAFLMAYSHGFSVKEGIVAELDYQEMMDKVK